MTDTLILTDITLQGQCGSKAAPGTLLDSLHRRHTSRAFAATPLSERHLSQLLWAAYGVNRPDGHRTAPAAMGLYALRIYVFLPEAIYLYRPNTDSLTPIVAGDYRGMAGMQDFVGTAPFNMAIYANYADFVTGNPDYDRAIVGHEDRMAALDAGAVAENVYLYCASEGLNVVERMMFDDKAFRKVAGLSDDEKFQVAMTVGYPE